MIPDGLVEALGSAVQRWKPVAGGDINQALQVELADGRLLFVKHRGQPPPGMYEAEAHGLTWLVQADAVELPAVVCYTDAFLVLEWVEPGHPQRHTWPALGRGLAALHGASVHAFGGPAGYIGTLPQAGGQSADWASFYGERRLRPQLRLAVDGGLQGRVARRIERLIHDLPARIASDEAPSRLHGDLWAGNLLIGLDGRPVLVDPAAYAGHREVDLAMMQLFGGFEPATFAAYDEVWPRAPGHAERVPLYQLYYLLVHLNLFGRGWLGRVQSALDSLGA